MLKCPLICSGGRDVWMSTARAFADQLESQGQHQRAVLYYLACHDTYKAIDVFRKQSMYRYVCKSRGVSGGSRIELVWCGYFKGTGSLFGACTSFDMAHSILLFMSQ